MANLSYTTTEAAEVLGVSASRVRQMILDGTIAAVKRGRDLMILPDALEQAKSRNTKPGPKKSTTGGEVTAATHAADDGAPLPEVGKPAEKARKKGAKNL